jgi:hypothetical protein
MDTLNTYRDIIEKNLTEYTKIPYTYGDITIETVFDRTADRYLLVNVGWDRGRRVHGTLVHIDIIDGKIWIQRDGTEEGIANELVEAGISKENIVLGFQPPEIRPHTDFAVA